MPNPKSCPIEPIKIKKDRKIISTDGLKFPWRQDKNGYFLIKIGGGKIHCGFVNNNHEMIMEFIGSSPDEMIKEIAKRKLCDIEHMGYVASELTIACGCLENGKKYVQR